MGRTTWVKPMTLVQKFEANEAVTACMQVVCQSDTRGEYIWFPAGFEIQGEDHHPAEDGPNPWGRGEWLGNTAVNKKGHPGHNCKNPNNGSGVIISNDGQISFADGRNLALHVDKDLDGLADIGDRIYWTSDEKISLVNYDFNHWGTVEPSSNKS